MIARLHGTAYNTVRENHEMSCGSQIGSRVHPRDERPCKGHTKGLWRSLRAIKSRRTCSRKCEVAENPSKPSRWSNTFPFDRCLNEQWKSIILTDDQYIRWSSTILKGLLGRIVLKQRKWQRQCCTVEVCQMPDRKIWKICNLLLLKVIILKVRMTN